MPTFCIISHYFSDYTDSGLYFYNATVYIRTCHNTYGKIRQMSQHDL